MKVRKVTEKYFIFSRSKGGFVEVDGEPITINGLEFDFFIHKGLPGADDWVVSEGITGSMFGSGMDRNEAIECGKEMVSGRSREGIKRAIEQGVERRGLSPRYEIFTETEFEELQQIATKGEKKGYEEW